MYSQVIHKILTIQWCNSDRIQPDASVESSLGYKGTHGVKRLRKVSY